MRVLLLSVFAAIVTSFSAFATASAQEDDKATQAVFVQSNELAANQVLAYRRAANGARSQVASYDTGGQGGRLTGAAVDPHASQGSLTFDSAHNLLIGVVPAADSFCTSSSA